MIIGRPSCTLKRIYHRLWCFKQLAQTIVFQATSKVLSTFMAVNFGRGKVVQLVPKPILLETLCRCFSDPFLQQTIHHCQAQLEKSPTGRLPHLHGRDILGCEDGTGSNHRQQNGKGFLTPKTGGKYSNLNRQAGKTHLLVEFSNEEERQQAIQILQGGHYMTPTQTNALFFGEKSLKIAIQIAACLIPFISWVPKKNELPRSHLLLFRGLFRSTPRCGTAHGPEDINLRSCKVARQFRFV